MTQKENSIILFHEKQVRRHWDKDRENWYFSIIDVIEILTDSSIPKRYWSDLKGKLKKEWSEVYEKIVHLKMLASDWKQRETDCFSTENLLRVIQSIPSPKAEPFKLWLAQVWNERINEMEKKPNNFLESKEVARKWGKIAGNTRKEIEAETWEKVVSSKNAKYLQNKEVKKL